MRWSTSSSLVVVQAMLAVAADQDERLAGDVHAAGVVAGPVQVLLAVDARRAEALLGRAPQQGVVVGRAPRRDDDGVRAAVRQHLQRDAGLQDRRTVARQRRRGAEHSELAAHRASAASGAPSLARSPPSGPRAQSPRPRLLEDRCRAPWSARSGR